jgi:hypothetical protein
VRAISIALPLVDRQLRAMEQRPFAGITTDE